MLSKIYEKADWKEGDGRRIEAVGQVDTRRGSHGGCGESEAHARR